MPRHPSLPQNKGKTQDTAVAIQDNDPAPRDQAGAYPTELFRAPADYLGHTFQDTAHDWISNVGLNCNHAL